MEPRNLARQCGTIMATSPPGSRRSLPQARAPGNPAEGTISGDNAYRRERDCIGLCYADADLARTYFMRVPAGKRGIKPCARLN